jgi:hypothetical protein
MHRRHAGHTEIHRGIGQPAKKIVEHKNEE